MRVSNEIEKLKGAHTYFPRSCLCRVLNIPSSSVGQYLCCERSCAAANFFHRWFQVHLCMCADQAQLWSSPTVISIISLLRRLSQRVCNVVAGLVLLNVNNDLHSSMTRGINGSLTCSLSLQLGHMRTSRCQKRKSFGGPTARRLLWVTWGYSSGCQWCQPLDQKNHEKSWKISRKILTIS